MADGVEDFDLIIDRRAVPGEKWSRYEGRDVIPMWVADMDFAAPEVVLDAIRRRLDHGVLGYTDAWPSLEQAVVDAMLRDYGWPIEPGWVVWLPGMVSALNVACRAIGDDGDGVFTATPIYPPFLRAPANNRRRLQHAALRAGEDGRWRWDWAATEAAMDASTRLFMLCNPHNPVGRVFDRQELERVAEICERRDLVICSDEIHCGLVLDEDRRHLPIAALDRSVAARTITLMAPSKTWNIPSLYCAFAIIPDRDLRRRFRHAMRGIVPHPNLLGLVATEAAYRDGEPWRRRLVRYLRDNRERVGLRLAAAAAIQTTLPEATYLAWLDCRRFASERGIDDLTGHFDSHGVGISDGRGFGAPGFVRVNFGCSRQLLEQGLGRMLKALR
ncbi:MAG: PatB family C-S lyase [Rhodocyclaceae bacterium]|nr:PatB family C-S lyase [Rhodocyclaceae bacterium]